MGSNQLDELVLVYFWLIVLKNRDEDKVVKILKYFQEHPEELYKSKSNL